MGTKYRHTRHIEKAREAHGARIDPSPPRLSLGHRQRLLIIYGGILLFCAFLLVGQLYLRIQERAGTALLRGPAEILRIESAPGGGRALLRPLGPEGGGQEIWADLTPEHAALREGQRVGVLFRWQQGALSVAEVGRVALPDNAAIDSPARETRPNPEASPP